MNKITELKSIKDLHLSHYFLEDDDVRPPVYLYQYVRNYRRVNNPALAITVVVAIPIAKDAAQVF
jgi:hypothetical protein